MGSWCAGFSRANPPAILKVDLGNAGEVVRLLEEVKYVLFSQLWCGEACSNVVSCE